MTGAPNGAGAGFGVGEINLSRMLLADKSTSIQRILSMKTHAKNPMEKAQPKKTFLSASKRPSFLGASIATLLASLVLGSSSTLFAASATWSATPTDANWVTVSTETNWSTGAGAYPGSTSGVTNTDVATFNSASTQNSITINSPTLNIGSITFSSGAGAYTIGSTSGNSLLLTSGGTIQTTGTSNLEQVSAPLVIEGASGAYTISSNSSLSTSVLIINGGITGGAAGATVLTLAGANTGYLTGVVANGSATTLGLTETGGGTWVLSAANTYTGATNVNTGTLIVNGSIAAGSTVNVGSAGTLAGIGTINGNVTLTGAGIINFSTGGSIGGALTVTGGNWNGAGTVTGGVTASGAANTFTIGTGANLTATAGLNLAGGKLAGAGTLTGSLNDTSAQASVFGGVIADGASPSTVTVNNSATTLTLNGASTYTGATTITAGTLSLGSSGSIAAGSAVGVGTTGTLNFASGGAVGGNVTLTGGATVTGSGGTIGGTLGVTGGNWNATSGTVTGLVTASGAANTFTIGNGANLTATAGVNLTGGQIAGTGTLTGNLNDTSAQASTFAGVIAGAGNTLTVNNAATTLTLSGANTYTGGTLVNAGSLILNGSIASAQTTVNPGASFIGNGSVGGNLTNNGILAPLDLNPSDYSAGGGATTIQSLQAALAAGGNSITGVTLTSNLALSIKGNYTQGATGTLVMLYAGTASNEHTSLTIQGQANLGGTLRLIQVNGGSLSAGQEATIITATGGVKGVFSNVANAPLINATVVYEPNSVILESTQPSPQSTASTTNALVNAVSSNPTLVSVASGIASASSDPRAAALFAVLDAATPGQLGKDIQLISPDSLSATGSVGSASSGVHVQNLVLRMQAIQSGATGFSAMGLRLSDNSTGETADGYAGPTGPDDKGGKEVTPPPANNRWGSFITGAGEFDRVGDTQSAPGFNLDSGGITLGVDYRFTDHFVAGLFAGYTYTGINIAQGGRIDVDAGKIGLYATYFDGGFYVNSAVQGGYDTYETDRTGLGGIAHSSPVGGDVNVLFAPGYNWTVGGLTFGPTSRFQYSYESTNGFTETGSLAPLTVASQHFESIVSAIGMKASYDWKIGTTIIRPELRLEWEHEYGDVASSVAAQLSSGAGNTFTVTGPEIGRDSMHLGAGFSVVFTDRLSTYLYYDGEFFRTNYESSVITGGFRFTF